MQIKMTGPAQKSIMILNVLLSALHATTPPDSCRQATWETNGTVNAIYPVGDKVYIGGAFSYVGPHTGSGVPINSGSGVPLLVFPKVEGTIYTVIADGNGGWYIGGYFQKVDGNSLNNIAHIFSNGKVDHNWNPNANNSSEYAKVYSLAVNGSTLYVAGDFTSIGGQERKNIAALDVATGKSTPWNPDPNYDVYTLGVSGSMVYVGGLFNYIGGQSRRHLAALDAATGKATPWNPDADNIVESLAINGSTVFAGGAFDRIGYGISHRHFGQFGDILPNHIKPHDYQKHFSVSKSADRLTFQYLLLNAEKVSIRLYSLQGKLKYVPLDSKQSAGNHTVTLRTGEFTPGAYLAVLQTGNKVLEQKLVLVH